MKVTARCTECGKDVVVWMPPDADHIRCLGRYGHRVVTKTESQTEHVVDALRRMPDPARGDG